MKFIGITGGVGAGKSAILSYMASKPRTKVLLADEIAHQLMEPGTECYEKIVEAFSGEDILDIPENVLPDSSQKSPFHRGKLAQVIFSDDEKREKMNAIVHPAVKEFVRREYEKEQSENKLDLFVLEAALLIEENYDEICDELWYIYTSEENRRARLKASRGYSDEKIDQIFASQLSEMEFRSATAVTIDNNGMLEETCQQIEKALRSK